MSSYLTKDELGKYLKDLPKNSTASRTGGNLRGPRPPVKPATWRLSSSSVNEISSPMRNLSMQEDAACKLKEQVRKLQETVGDVTTEASQERPTPPPKPRNGDPFESALTPRSRLSGRQRSEVPPAQTPPVGAPSAPRPTSVASSATSSPAVVVQKQQTPARASPPISPGTKPPRLSPKPRLPSSPKPSSSPADKVSVTSPLYVGSLCAGCDKPISGRVIKDEQNQWHVDCFKCKHCGQDLEYVAFYTKDGQPYCALDYHELFSLRCDYCGTPIEEKSINALGKHYHVGHFFCRECGKPFDESSAFMVQEGHPYCEQDYLRKFGHKCMGCGEYITGEFLNALDGDWHKDCFVCADCGKAFTSNSFFVRNNKPYCEQHYKHPLSQSTSKICRQCRKVIDGRSVSAFGEDYHPNHFQCNSCNKLLSVRVPGMWQEGNQGELICKICARKS